MKEHTTHRACNEIIERDGGKAVGCCCTGHECKKEEPTSFQDKFSKEYSKEFPMTGNPAVDAKIVAAGNFFLSHHKASKEEMVGKLEECIRAEKAAKPVGNAEENFEFGRVTAFKEAIALLSEE